MRRIVRGGGRVTCDSSKKTGSPSIRSKYQFSPSSW
jgi:hypothetical protein